MIEQGGPLSLTRQCALLGVSRSSQYYRPKGESAENLALMRRMDELHMQYPFYGSRQLMRHLRREGVTAGRHRIRRLMAVMGMEATYRRPRTSVASPEHRVFPYLLRGLSISRADHVWCADITYVPVTQGFFYLVAVMDWATRHVLAWRLSNTMDASFCVEALDDALGWRAPEIFNTDQGSQGEFKRSSQHLREMLRWQRAGTEERIEPYVHGCVHQAVRRWDAASIGRGSGKRSLEVCRARRPPWQRVCPLLSGHAGFANVVACHHSIFVPSHGAISRSLSEKRSPFFEPVVVACARSPGSWAAHPRRSRENCGATQLQEEGTSSIGPRPLNGTPTGERNVQSLRSSLRTAN